jgi:hypothetical protein
MNNVGISTARTGQGCISIKDKAKFDSKGKAKVNRKTRNKVRQQIIRCIRDHYESMRFDTKSERDRFIDKAVAEFDTVWYGRMSLDSNDQIKGFKERISTFIGSNHKLRSEFMENLIIR